MNIRTFLRRVMRKSLSHHIDDLTGVYSRYGFDKRSKKLLAQRSRHELLAIAYLDLDRFLEINDSLGWETGDEYLKSIGAILQNYMSKRLFVGRYAGDEFAVIGRMDISDLSSIADEIRKEIEALSENRPMEFRLQVTCSIGVAEYEPGKDIAGVITHADMAMLQAKQSGGNRVCCFGQPTSE